jgi:FkbM family methyltransferase
MTSRVATLRRLARSRIRRWLAAHPRIRLRAWDLRRLVFRGADPRPVGPIATRRGKAVLALPLPPSGRTPRSRTLEIHPQRSMFIARSLAESGFGGYEVESLACFLAMTDHAGDGDVLDIGANVGVYGLLASGVTQRRVVAFEPTPWIADEASATAALNGLPLEVRATALGAQRTVATFYLSDRTDASNSLAAGFRSSSRQIDVRVETLDRLTRRNGLRPAVLKIDTESTEPSVLRGGARTLRRFRPWILCEVLHGRSESGLMEALEGLGYHWYHVVDHVPYEMTTDIVGDPTYTNLMWLFAPEAPSEGFWASVRAWRAALEELDAGRPTGA